jgi:DNA-binding NtrC family response regulator
VLLLLDNARDRAVTDLSDGADTHHRLFAQSPAMQDLIVLLRETAGRPHHVSIVGEPATGRSLVAATLHRLSGGDADSFVAVDCAGAPQELEGHLFGLLGDRPPMAGQPSVERVTRDSAISRALGGTLFLRHLPEASARVQARLARLLRDRELTIDGRSVVPLDLRLIASMPSDVNALVADGRMLDDLVGRVAQVKLEMPTLRQRPEDIPLLAVHFARQAGANDKTPSKGFSRSALALLSALPWHGNATELATFIDTLHRSVARRIIQIEDVLGRASLDGFTTRVDTTGSLREARARFERECISAVLLRHHGRMGDAAKALGIQRTNLYRKIRQLKVPRAAVASRR